MNKLATYDLTSTTPTELIAGDILNCPYSGAAKSIILPKGKYKFECWGASGGLGPDSGGGSQSSYKTYGKGGYSVGTIKLPKKTTVYIYAGGQGKQAAGRNTTGYAGGFNGGGAGGPLSSTSSYTNGSGGGGASDIRIGQDSLYARVIVAGGGGGSSWQGNGSSSQYGGAGGGTSGIAATVGSGQSSGTTAQPGTQTSGGAGGAPSSTSYGTTGNSGTFGVGGSGPSNSSSIINSGAGGGGGWYGGGSGAAMKGGYQGHGAGGSGFIWTGSNAPDGYLLNSKYYLTDASTTAGNTSFTGTSGSSETGHDGNGYCRITVIELYTSFTGFVNIGGSWKEIDSAYANIGGTWKEIEGIYANIGGSWKESG